MIVLNAENKYSPKLYFVILLSTLIPILFFSLLGTSKGFIAIFIFLLFIVEMPIMVYFIFKFDSVSFVVDENKITINKGVFTRRSDTMTFDRIQNIECVTSMLMGIFGVTRLNLWTASPSQVVITEGTSQNIAQGVLFLDSPDADWLKNYILNKRAPTPLTTPVMQSTSTL
jgi:uncharacterized membrane protein YdbT with pleckstrin-like domain